MKMRQAKTHSHPALIQATDVGPNLTQIQSTIWAFNIHKLNYHKLGPQQLFIL